MGAHIFKQHGTETQIAGGKYSKDGRFSACGCNCDVESVEVDAHTLAESEVGEEGRRLHTDGDALVVVGSGGGMDVAEHKRLVEIAGDVVGHDNAFKNDVFFDFLEVLLPVIGVLYFSFTLRMVELAAGSCCAVMSARELSGTSL